jgi:hypothetical protein
MLGDIVKYAFDNHAYIRPDDDLPNKIIGFKCHVSNKQWQINAKDYLLTRTGKEKITINNHKVRAYFCRAASCKMYDKFDMEMQAFLKSKKWFGNLGTDEKKYVLLIRRYLYLREKFN